MALAAADHVRVILTVYDRLRIHFDRVFLRGAGRARQEETV